jgi:hypothetical protein
MTDKKQLGCFETCSITILVLFLVLLGLTYFPWTKHWPFESQAELERIRSELSGAEARWKASGITDYDVDAASFMHPGACADFSKKDDWLYPLHLRVRQGQILYENEQQKQWAEMCHFESFLPPQVFDTLREEVKNSHPMAMYLTAEFDPAYGFMTSYHLTANGDLPDTNVSYKFTNFQPVPQEP